MIRKLLLSLAILALCCSARASNPYVTGTYRPLAQGWRAEFTLHNGPANGTIFMWYVATGDAVNASSPDGWVLMQNYRQVGWDADSAAHELQPGASLSGFGFTSQAQTSSYDWYVGFDHGYIGSVTLELVPEPSALMALAGGLSAMSLQFVRRRRRL